MKEYLLNRNFKVMSSVFILIVFLLIFVSFFDFKLIEYVLKSISIPVLMLLYILTSKQISKFYLVALFCAAISNILFMKFV